MQVLKAPHNLVEHDRTLARLAEHSPCSYFEGKDLLPDAAGGVVTRSYSRYPLSSVRSFLELGSGFASS